MYACVLYGFVYSGGLNWDIGIIRKHCENGFHFTVGRYHEES